MPALRRAMQEIFGDALCVPAYPERAVANGVTLKAAELMGRRVATEDVAVLDEPRELAAPPYPRMSSLDQKVAELEIRVEQLLRLMSAAGAAPLTQNARVGLTTDGGELQQN